MITSKGGSIDRENTHVPIEFYTRDLRGGKVLTRIIKKKLECATFYCPDFGKQFTLPLFCKFEVAVFGEDDQKTYKTITLRQLFKGTDSAYVLSSKSKDVKIIFLDLGEKEINWPESQFDFDDGEFFIRY